MDHIRVRATAAVFGLSRGDVAVVELTPTVDAAVSAGLLVWLDPPAAAEPEVTEVVKQRKPRAKKAEDEGAAETDAGAAPILSVDPVHGEEAPKFNITQYFGLGEKGD